MVQRGTAFTSKSVANDGRGGTAREDRDSSEGSTAALQEMACGSAHGSKQGIARRLRGGDGEAVVVEAAGGTQKYGEVEKAGGAGGDAFAAAHAFSASSEDKAARHAACRKCRGNLLASLRLRGGCGNEEEAQGLDFGATQSFDFDDEEEGEPQQRRLLWHTSLWLKDGATVGAAAELPSMDGILALGRVVQPTPRAGSGDVETLELADADRAAAPLVSGLQAEIHVDDDGHMILTSKGKSYNFINGNPLHVSGSQAAAAGVPSQARLYDGDDIRLGGDLDGRQRGGYDKFCFRVEAPELGLRPACAATAAAASPVTAVAAAAAAPAAAAVAAPAVAQAPVPAAAPVAGGVLLRYCGEGLASAGLECVQLSEGRTVLGSGAEATCRLTLPAEAKHVTVSVSRLGTVAVHAHAALSLTRRNGETHLVAGEQRSVFDRTVLRVAGTSLRFEVPVRRPEPAAAAQPASVASPAQHAPAAAAPVPQPAAERLASAGLTAGAAIAELTASLSGQAKRREEVRLGLAVQGVLATAAAAGEPEERQRQVARQVAGQMSRVENQYDSTIRAQSVVSWT